MHVQHLAQLPLNATEPDNMRLQCFERVRPLPVALMLSCCTSGHPQVAQAQADCVLGLPGLGVGCGLKLRAGSCADGLCLPDTPKGVTDYLRRQGTQQQHYQPPSRLGGQQAQGCGREARGRSASCSYGGELLPPSAAGQAAEGCVAQEACCGAAEAAARTCLAPGTQPACGQEPSTCRMGRPEGHGKDKQEQHLQQEQDHSGMPGDAGATWGLGGDEMQPPATPPTHPLAPQPPPLQGVGSSRSDNNSGSSVALPRAVVDGLAVVAGCAGLGVAGREQQQQQEQRRSYLSQLEDEHNGGSDAGGGPEGAGEGSGAPTAEGGPCMSVAMTPLRDDSTVWPVQAGAPGA